jgi:hypothetical protein
MAERRRQADCKLQEMGRINWLVLALLKPVPIENAVQGLSARVGENKDCPSFVSRERHGLGRPGGLKFRCEREFVLQAS